MVEMKKIFKIYINLHFLLIKTKIKIMRLNKVMIKVKIKFKN